MTKRYRLILLVTLIVGLCFAFSGEVMAQDNEDDLTAQEYFDRGMVNFDASAYEEAIADFTSAIELDATYADAYFYRALSNYNLGVATQAQLDDLNTAIEYDFYSPAWAYNIRGLVNFRMGNPESAIADFEQAIALSPTYRVAYANIAWVYELGFQDYEGMVTAYKRMMNSVTTLNADTYNSMAWGYFRIGWYAEALNWVNHALELNPENGNAIDTRAWAYLRLGEYDLALADFEQAIALDNTYSYYGIAVLYNELGQTSLAIENLQIYLNESPYPETEAVALLEELQSQ